MLRQVGEHWERVLGGHQAWLRPLLFDPGLHRFGGTPVVGRGGRLAAVDFVARVDPGEVVATPHAGGVFWAGAGDGGVSTGAVWAAAGRQRSGARADAQTRGTADLSSDALSSEA